MSTATWVNPIPEGIALDRGTHRSLAEGACVMELVSYVAGEPWSDHPACVHPALTNLAIRINDDMKTAEERAALLPFVPIMRGTNGGIETSRALAFAAADYAARTIAPEALERAGRDAYAYAYAAAAAAYAYAAAAAAYDDAAAAAAAAYDAAAAAYDAYDAAAAAYDAYDETRKRHGITLLDRMLAAIGR